jgi:benzoate/toluate 1,2-dioxygenase alpha subunit
VVANAKFTPASVTDLVQEGPTDFHVHSNVYTDPDIFQQELHDIFENGWVYVAHESEIAIPGDYVTRRIGTQPVIVTRGPKHEVNVLLNVCRHRANAICREQMGNSFNFRCPYHSWTYANTGELLGVADRTRYPKGFGDGLDLLKAAKVGSYQGLIFASLNANVPDLDDHLAGIKHQIDYWADRSLEGSNTLLLPHRYGYSGNWKF